MGSAGISCKFCPDDDLAEIEWTVQDCTSRRLKFWFDLTVCGGERSFENFLLRSFDKLPPKIFHTCHRKICACHDVCRIKPVTWCLVTGSTTGRLHVKGTHVHKFRRWHRRRRTTFVREKQLISRKRGRNRVGKGTSDESGSLHGFIRVCSLCLCVQKPTPNEKFCSLFCFEVLLTLTYVWLPTHPRHRWISWFALNVSQIGSQIGRFHRFRTPQTVPSQRELGTQPDQFQLTGLGCSSNQTRKLKVCHEVSDRICFAFQQGTRCFWKFYCTLRCALVSCPWWTFLLLFLTDTDQNSENWDAVFCKFDVT